MLFVVLCPGTPEGSTGSGSGFKATQKTGQRLKVSSDRLGEAGNRTCDPWFTRHRFIPYTTAASYSIAVPFEFRLNINGWNRAFLLFLYSRHIWLSVWWKSNVEKICVSYAVEYMSEFWQCYTVSLELIVSRLLFFFLNKTCFHRCCAWYWNCVLAIFKCIMANISLFQSYQARHIILWYLI